MLPGAMPGFCPYCGEQHPDDFLYCPKTGKPLRESTDTNRPRGRRLPRRRPLRDDTGAVAVPSQSQAQMRWEYKDIVIPLGYTIGEARAGKVRASELLDQRVLRCLQEEGTDGWQADHLTDYQSLYDQGRIATSGGIVSLKAGLLGAISLGLYAPDLENSKLFESVTIRLKRRIPA